MNNHDRIFERFWPPLRRRWRSAPAFALSLLAACIAAPAIADAQDTFNLVERRGPTLRIYYAAEDRELSKEQMQSMLPFAIRQYQRLASIPKAAEELGVVMEKMTGQAPEIMVVENPDGVDRDRPGIVLGVLAEKLGCKAEKTSVTRDGFRIKADPPLVLIAGEQAGCGVYHGVYTFLESLGCGWYVPGDVGEVIPRRHTVSVPVDLDHSEYSKSVQREYWGYGEWALKNKGLASVGSWRHAWKNMIPKELFEEKPELWALFRGSRNRRSQLCTTNPETIEIAANSLLQWMGPESRRHNDLVFECGPSDGGGLCQCDECSKLHTEGYIEHSRGWPCYTDNILQFANDLAEITSKVHPDKLLGFYVYSEYSRPPLKVKEMHPNVMPMIAPIRRCRLHGVGNPICEMNMVHLEEIRAWAAMTDKLGFYNYNFNLADVVLPWSKIDFYRHQQKLLRELDLDMVAFTTECINAWSLYGPHQYLSTRYMWNTEIDIDAEMEKFYTGFYAEAAAPMRAYWTALDERYANTDTHVGSLYGAHHIWTEDFLARCRNWMDEGRRRARSDRVKEAVEMTAAGVRVAELYMDIRKNLAAGDFSRAGEIQEELRAHLKMMSEQDPEWGHRSYTLSYYNSFFGRSVDRAAGIMNEGGRKVVMLPDTWKAHTDEDLTGAEKGWGAADFDDSAWGEMATFDKSWSDQGLLWYHKDLWYRTRFDLAEQDLHGDLRLFFAGFDHNVDVYLNGVRLPRGYDEAGEPLRDKDGAILYEQVGFMRPAEYTRIRGALKAGENVIAVRCSFGDLAEIGTGGIMMPVMLYRAAGEDPAPAPDKEDDPAAEFPVYDM